MHKQKPRAQKCKRYNQKRSEQCCRQIIQAMPHFYQTHLAIHQLPVSNPQMIYTIEEQRSTFYQGQSKHLLDIIKILHDRLVKTNAQKQQWKKKMQSAQIKASQTNAQQRNTSEQIEMIKINLREHYQTQMDLLIQQNTSTKQKLKKLQKDYDKNLSNQRKQIQEQMNKKFMEEKNELEKKINQKDAIINQKSKEMSDSRLINENTYLREQFIAMIKKQDIRIEQLCKIKYGKQLEQYQKEKEQLSQKIKEMQDKIKKLKQEYESKDRKMTINYIDQIKKLQQQKQKAEAKAKKIQEEYQKAFEEYTKEIKSLQQGNQAFRNIYEQKIKILQQQKHKYLNKIKQLQNSLDKEKVENNLKNSRIENLQQDNNTINKQIANKQKEAEQNLKNSQVRLQKIQESFKLENQTIKNCVQHFKNQLTKSKQSQTKINEQLCNLRAERNKLTIQNEKLSKQIISRVESQSVLKSKISQLEERILVSRVVSQPPDSKISVEKDSKSNENKNNFSEALDKIKRDYESYYQNQKIEFQKSLKAISQFYQNKENYWVNQKLQLEKKIITINQQMKQKSKKVQDTLRQHVKEIEESRRLMRKQLQLQQIISGKNEMIETLQQIVKDDRKKYEKAIDQSVDRIQHLQQENYTKSQQIEVLSKIQIKLVQELALFKQENMQYGAQIAIVTKKYQQLQKLLFNAEKEIKILKAKLQDKLEQQKQIQRIAKKEAQHTTAEILKSVHQNYYAKMKEKDDFIRDISEESNKAIPNNEIITHRQKTITSLFQSTEKTKLLMTEYKNQSKEKVQQYHNRIFEINMAHQHETEQLRKHIDELISTNQKLTRFLSKKLTLMKQIYTDVTEFNCILAEQENEVNISTNSKKQIYQLLHNKEATSRIYYQQAQQHFPLAIMEQPIQQQVQHQNSHFLHKSLQQKQLDSCHISQIEALSEEKLTHKSGKQFQKIKNQIKEEICFDRKRGLTLNEGIKETQSQQYEDADDLAYEEIDIEDGQNVSIVQSKRGRSWMKGQNQQWNNLENNKNLENARQSLPNRVIDTDQAPMYRSNGFMKKSKRCIQ